MRGLRACAAKRLPPIEAQCSCGCTHLSAVVVQRPREVGDKIIRVFKTDRQSQ